MSCSILPETAAPLLVPSFGTPHTTTALTQMVRSTCMYARAPKSINDSGKHLLLSLPYSKFEILLLLRLPINVHVAAVLCYALLYCAI
jgi:hypothetical protein